MRGRGRSWGARRALLLSLVSLALLGGGLAPIVGAQAPPPGGATPIVAPAVRDASPLSPVVSRSAHHDTSPPLRAIPPAPAAASTPLPRRGAQQSPPAGPPTARDPLVGTVAR